MSLKLCECGCGLPAPLAKASDPRIPIKKGEPRRFIYGHWARTSEGRTRAGSSGRSAELNPQWKGGRRIEKSGYVSILKPDHPAARSNGYVFEHILVLEAKLGRYLRPDEIGHHIDGNRQNNDPQNLEAMTRPEHTQHHKFWLNRKNIQRKAEPEQRAQIS